MNISDIVQRNLFRRLFGDYFITYSFAFKAWKMEL